MDKIKPPTHHTTPTKGWKVLILYILLTAVMVDLVNLCARVVNSWL